MERMEDSQREPDPGGIYSIQSTIASAGRGTDVSAGRGIEEFSSRMFPMRLQVDNSCRF